MPRLRLTTHLAQHPFINTQDEARHIEYRDERIRADEATLRVLPAQERLDTDDLVVVQGDNRLVMQPELVAFQVCAGRLRYIRHHAACPQNRWIRINRNDSASPLFLNQGVVIEI